MNRTATVVASLLFSAACSTTTKPVNMAEPRRVVGTESAVRIDAEITDAVGVGAPLTISYVITNHRAEAIAVADIIPETTFDRESRMVTVSIGAEVPGEVMLPRLVRIGPGEKKSFNTTARVVTTNPVTSAGPRTTSPTLMRLKLNFLGDTVPFVELIGIPERAVADRKRADELFAPWLERNEAVYTNAVPVEMSVRRSPETDTESRIPVSVRRGRRGGS